MSQIYEALQRAEQDRLAAQGKGAAAATASATLVEEVVPVALAVVTPVRIPAMEVVSAEPVAEALAEAAPEAEVAEAPVSELDLENVAVRVWSPNLKKLPSLEERGHAVEQFRTLRTRLFSFRDLNMLKTMMVSSGLPREGKSFVAANLAVSFARHKESRVLLIDGDMRRSSLHELLGCEKAPGLSTYLAGNASMTEVMQRGRSEGEKLPAGLRSLTFIGGGDAGDKAADLSGSPKFRELLERAAPHFDWIIVDSSPVNLVTDGVNLAASCDAVLLVARAGVTKFETARRALNELKASQMLGVVLNAAPVHTVTEGYYGYDGYDGKGPYDSKEN